MTSADLRWLNSFARELARDQIVRNVCCPIVWADLLEALSAPFPWNPADLLAVEASVQDVLTEKAVRLVADRRVIVSLTYAVARTIDMDPIELETELAIVAEARWLRTVGDSR